MRSLFRLLPTLSAVLLASCSEEPGPPAPSCELVTCAVNSHCALLPDPVCVCDEGFELRDGACVEKPPTSVSGDRSAEGICAEWKAAHVIASPNPFTAGASNCDPGTITPEAIADTVRRVNVFRWLVGLGPVKDDAKLNNRSQLCSVITAWNPPKAGYNPHRPTAGVQCYNTEGAAGAGQSNLAWGSGHPAQAIDQFMQDQGSEDTLGHRRWIIHPPLGPIGVGYYEHEATSYRNAECLHVFSDAGGGARPAWYAFPPPGFSPVTISRWPWTFHSGSLDAGKVTVSMKRIGTSEPLPVDVKPLPDGYGDPAVSWTPRGWIPFAGETYEVTITGFQSEPLTYKVSPIDCK